MKEISEEIRRICGADASLFVLTDRIVDALIPGLLKGSPRLVMAGGEEIKSVEGAVEVWNFLESQGAVRSSVLVNVGGGSVSDLGGFAASTFKRGIGFVNLPTTLLAAVDAAIGGKTGINFAGLKNEIGTFAMPKAVIPLPGLFGSLSDEEWLSGAGEALKTGLLAGADLFDMAASEEFLLKRDPSTVEEVVRRCAEFKQKIVEEDFRESGKRRILNLGHTEGHAIEALMLAKGRPVAHGIAVAHGLLAALRRGVEAVGTPQSLVSRYERILMRYFPPLRLEEADEEALARLRARDKKNRAIGSPEWVYLRDVGCPVW